MEWINLGNLTNPDYFTLGGVYLLVHRGLYNRVVYVGTSHDIIQRALEHHRAYLGGHRTIWRVRKDEDIYRMMSTWEIRNCITYFRKLAREEKVWASTTIEKMTPRNLLLPEQEYTQDWRSWLREEYLPQISLWALALKSYAPRAAVRIESALQQRLVATFQLGRFLNHEDISILGKIEFNQYSIRLREPFENVPDLDEASRMVFATMTDKTIPSEVIRLSREQLSDVISERKALQKARQMRRAEKLDRYPNQGQRWSLADLEKLRLMVVDFAMTSAEIATHLRRDAKTIQKRIEENDKLSSRRWRISIAEL